MQKAYDGADKALKYLFQNAKNVSISGTSETGTTIAVLTIDGNETNIKAPAGTEVSYTAEVTEGTTIGTLTIGETPYELKCPVASTYTPNLDDDISARETVGGQPITVYDEPTYKIGTLGGIGVYAPPATGVVYESNYQSGVIVGKIIVRTIATDPNNNDASYVADKDEYQIIIPSSSGGGNVDDVVVTDSSGTHSVVNNHIASIDLTDYATDDELTTAVAALQASFQAGVDAIYNACVAKGSTPVSHSLSDVVDAIYVIGGNLPHAEITSSNTIPMRFSSSVEDNT